MKSATSELRKALNTKLKAISLPVSKDVNTFPRIEIVEVSENSPVDKEDNVRECGFVLEVVSNTNFSAAFTIHESAIEALSAASALSMTGFRCVLIENELNTEINEVGEGDALIRRLRSQFRTVIEQVEIPVSNNQ